MGSHMVLVPTTVELVDRSAWLAERRLGCGGSEIHHIYNDKPFGCRLRLWYEKVGIPPDFPQQYNSLLDYGLYLEPWIRAGFERRTGRTVVSRETIVDPKLPWRRANLDGVITADQPGRRWVGNEELIWPEDPLSLAPPKVVGERKPSFGPTPAMYEAKSVNSWYFDKVKRHGLRADHIRQGTWNGGLLESDWGSFAIQNRDSSEQIAIDFEVDRELDAMMIDDVGTFWTVDVEMKRQPDPLPQIDDRCRTCPWRRACRGNVDLGNMEYPDDSRQYEVIDSEELHVLAEKYEQAVADVKARDALRKDLGKQIVELLTIRMPDGSVHRERERVLNMPWNDKVTHAWRKRGAWDTDALKTAPNYLSVLFEHREDAIRILEEAGIEATLADLRELYYREDPRGGGQPLLISHPKTKASRRK